MLRNFLPLLLAGGLGFAALPASAGGLEAAPAGGEGPRRQLLMQRDTASSFFLPRHRRIVFQFDTRYSLVSSQRATINGIKLGMEWRSRLRTGLGVYNLSPTTTVNVKPGADWPDGTTARAQFRYVALYGEYVLKGNPRWEISAPVQVGYGRYWVQYTDPDGLRSRSASQRICLVEPTIAAQMRIFRWIGIGAGTGWRQLVKSDLPPGQSLNGPIFYSRVKLYLGDLVRTVRGRQPLFTQKGLRRSDWKRANGEPLDDVLDDDDAEE